MKKSISRALSGFLMGLEARAMKRVYKQRKARLANVREQHKDTPYA